MIPTVVLIGSLLVPATAVIWYLDHYGSPLVIPALTIRVPNDNTPLTLTISR
jgi:hypothetical protein